MKTLREKGVPVVIDLPIAIPTPDGNGIAETIMYNTKALKDPETGEIYLNGETLEKIDQIKARHMGLLLPNQIKELRLKLNMTQDEISEILKLGEKTYTLWETGRGRPSQSMNLILSRLWEGRLNIADLIAEKETKFDWSRAFAPYRRPSSGKPAVCQIEVKECANEELELITVAA